LRAVLRVERDAEKREGEVGFVARLYAYAGKAYLRLEFTLESYEPFVPVAATPNYQAICNAKHIRKLAYCLRLPGKATAIQLGGVPETVPVQAAGSLALQQLEPRAFTVQSPGGEVIANGEQAPGWIAAVRDGCSVALATKWFWEIAPKALGYDARSAELVLQLRPDAAPGPGYPLAAGRVKTYEFMLGLDVPGPQLSAGTRAELRAYPDPDYVAATGATHRFVSLTDPRFTTFADYVRRTVEKAAAVRLYGDLDFGDQIGWNADQRWNGYHGTTHEWFTFYLASGDPALFRIAEQETWHSIDVDTQHWGYAPGCREAEYARKQDHVCAAPIQGGIKVWNFGEIDCYFLTGRRRVLESLARNARFLLACGGVANRNYTPERATSLPFLHLSYLYEALGDEAALAQAFPAAMAPGAGRFRNDAIGTEPSAAWLATLADINAHFNRVYDRGEHMWCSFLASYPAEAFHRYYILTRDKTAANGVIKAARFLYHDMTMPTGIPKYAGGKPWSDDSPWIPWWDGVEAPAALAYLVSGDRTCLDWGAAPADWLLNYRGYGYSSGPWSWQGALGFGGTLSTYLWALREAGLTEAHVTRLRADLDYGNALAVCRSQCLAQRAPALQNTPESNVFCRLAAEVGRVLVNQGRYDEAIEWLSQWDTAPYGVYVSWVLTRARTLKAGAPAERQ
jgi:hypothetical protein